MAKSSSPAWLRQRLAAPTQPTVRAVVDDYNGRFYKHSGHPAGRWRRIGSVGNAGIAEQFCTMLKKLGHVVEIVDEGSD